MPLREMDASESTSDSRQQTHASKQTTRMG
jgi:hypothetical protein